MHCICATTDDEDDIDWFDPLTTPREKKIKIALLGTSSSGKTTIIKQLKKMTESCDEPDAKQMASFIKDSLVTNMKNLCHQSTILQEFNNQTAVHKSIRYLRDEMLALRDSEDLNADIAFKIRELWHDQGIQNTLRQRHTFQVADNLSYFFDKIDLIAAADYKPDFEDEVRIQRRSIGYSPFRFVKYIYDYGEFFFEMPDVGGTRSERRKWWSSKLLEDPDLTGIVYVVPLSDYNLTLYEDNQTNRLKDAINLFRETMIKGKFFRNKPLFLLFNKYDIYLEKIKNIPISHWFDDFPENEYNPHDPDHVVKFIAGQFLKVFTEYNVELSEPLRILRTTAIDEDNIETVFGKIFPRIVKQNVVNFYDVDSDFDTDN
eukprot:595229_1